MIKQRRFTFQLQFGPVKKAGDDKLILELVDAIKSCGGSLIEVTSGEEDNEQFTNINFKAEDACSFWNAIKVQLATDNLSKTSRIMIAACEGKKSWNDYLLLYHYDKTLICDKLD